MPPAQPGMDRTAAIGAAKGRSNQSTRIKGQPGEQATMFLLDPSGNALEFKALADRSKLFAK